MRTRIYAAPAAKGLSYFVSYPLALTLGFNPLTAGAVYIRVFVFIGTLSTTF